MLNPSKTQLTAIDWSVLGRGAVGAEIGMMTGVSLRYMDFPAAQADAFDQTVFENYVDGLREGGWTGEVGKVRLGYTINAFLVCGVVWMLGNLEGIQQPENMQDMAAMVGHPIDQVLESFALTQRLLVKLGEEAYSLL